MGKLSFPPAILKKLYFLEKYSNKVLVDENSISTSSVSIQCSYPLSDTKFGIKTKDLIDMVKNTSEFELKDQKIYYKYTISNLDVFKNEIKDFSYFESQKIESSQDNKAIIKKYSDLYDLKYQFDFENPILTIKLPKFNILSTDDTDIVYKDNKLILSTNNFVKTRLVFDVEKIDGTDNFCARMRGHDIKMASSFEENSILCYHTTHIVFYFFEDTITTAMVLKIIN